MNKFGNNGLNRLKSRMNGPAKDETPGIGSTDQQIAEAKRKYADIVARNKKKIVGSLNQQIVFNRKRNPSYAKKMVCARNKVSKRLGNAKK